MAGSINGHWRTWSIGMVGAAATVALVASQSLFGMTASAAPAAAKGGVRPKAAGLLDCNGYSKIQKALTRKLACTDIRGMNGYPRFFDNGHYIGHDEPSIRFISNRPGSGNNVTYQMTLPKDPPTLPRNNGSGGTDSFQLHPTFWLGMVMCDSQGSPNPDGTALTGHATVPCKPDSNSNIYASENPSSSHYFGLGPGQAYVLGSSGGATYGLDLVARYPGRVRTLVAHEPPVSELLPDAARYHALNEQVGETYRSEGTFPALQMFTKGVGFDNGGPPQQAEQTPEAAAAAARTGGNLELFAGRLIPIIGNYQPDLAALQRSSTRIVVGVGDESTAQQMVYQTAHALAERLGSQPVEFPGGHGGFGSHPDGFATRLREVLATAER